MESRTLQSREDFLSCSLYIVLSILSSLKLARGIWLIPTPIQSNAYANQRSRLDPIEVFGVHIERTLKSDIKGPPDSAILGHDIALHQS